MLSVCPIIKNLHPNKKSDGLRYNRKRSRQVFCLLGSSAFIHKTETKTKMFTVLYQIPKNELGIFIMVTEFSQVQCLRKGAQNDALTCS